MADFRIRCSSIGKIMTEPKNKGEVLSVGAKTHIRELAAQDIFGVDFDISDRKLEKGIRVEPASLALLNNVRGLSLVKNEQRRTNAWITGEADLFDTARRRGHDLKSAWSIQTFPLCPEDIADAQRKLYDWQMRGYCILWDADEWEVNYALVNTPEDLIGYESATLHYVDHIPEHLRLTSWVVKRDAALDRAIEVKVSAARDYYDEFIDQFDRAHRAGDPLPAAPTPAPAPAAAVELPHDLFAEQ